MNNKTK